jgi:hypothetical protein
MEEEPQTPKAVEPAEEDLRELLETREQERAVGWQRLNRLSTWLVAGFLAVGSAAFLSSGTNREIIASLFREAPPAVPAAAPRIFAAAAENPDEEALKKAAGMPTRADEAARAKNGPLVDKEDIKFAMDLLQFMQGPPAKQAEPATSK